MMPKRRLLAIYPESTENIMASTGKSKVHRDYQDIFQNPDCLSKTKCPWRPKSCERYNAACVTRGRDDECGSCICGGETGTFSFIKGSNTGRCMNTKQLAHFPGQQERMNILITNEEMLDHCLYVSYWGEKPLDLHDRCDAERQYYWIYTKKKQLVSLDRFDCLTVAVDNKVTVAPCKASLKNQQWYCDGNGTCYYLEGKGSPKYVEGEFLLSTTNFQQWTSYNPENVSAVNTPICENPVDYQGCYRVDMKGNGFFVQHIDPSTKTFDSSSSSIVNVWAPIFIEHTKCPVNWKDSTYLKDSRPWRAVSKPDDGIT